MAVHPSQYTASHSRGEISSDHTLITLIESRKARMMLGGFLYLFFCKGECPRGFKSIYLFVI